MMKWQFSFFLVWPYLEKQFKSQFLNFDQLLKCEVQLGQIFYFVKLILFLKTCIEGGLAPSIQTVGSLLIPLWLAKPAQKII
jgi:hypothetical protein